MDYDDRIIDLERMIDAKISDLSRIVYQITEAQKSNAKYLDNMERDITKLSNILPEYKVLKLRMQELEKRIDDLQESKVWLARVVWGIIIATVIEAAFKFKFFAEIGKLSGHL